jgi:O-antigen ligase
LFRKSVFYGPIVYILTLNLVKSEDSARKILGVLITGCCIFSAFIFYKFFFGANLVGADSGERLGGYFMLYGNSTLSVTCMAIAGQVTLVSPLAVSFSFLSNRKSYRLLGFLSFFILLSVLLATLTRSGWVAILVGITVLVFLSAKFSDRFLNARTMALILILTVVVVATVSYTLRLNDYLFYRFQSLKYSLGDTSLLDRIDIWRRSLGAFFSQPLGMGFRALYNLGGISAYPHSIYLGSLLTCGFLGALGFFGFIFAWAKNVFACLRHETSSQMKMVFIGSLGALAALLFYGVFEDTMFMPDIVMVPAWVIFGVSAAFFGRKAGNETQHGT